MAGASFALGSFLAFWLGGVADAAATPADAGAAEKIHGAGKTTGRLCLGSPGLAFWLL